ncbi:MAG TPA: endonuclease/exonuclease/phosphatase family protein [Pirellulales bacterium]|nr:endonuclease/exonuclease/phosphatase family protein [Pirellulales bacterium]
MLSVTSAMLAGVTPDRETRPITLKLLTYNTHLLPRIGEAFASHRSRGDYRAETIGRRLAAYDLVGLCEVFDPRYREALIDAAQAGAEGKFHVLWTKKPRGVGLANSGLLLLSRFAIVEHHTITYTSASGFLRHGFRADGFAAKGALYARLRLREDSPLDIDCFLTHLESRSAAARTDQLRQLADFLRSHAAADRPTLLMGDLNMSAHGPAYSQLAVALASSGIELLDAWTAAGHGPGGTSDPLAEDGGRRIDYVWVSRGSGTRSRAAIRTVEVLRFLDSAVPEGSLSDHSGVACSLELR